MSPSPTSAQASPKAVEHSAPKKSRREKEIEATKKLIQNSQRILDDVDESYLMRELKERREYPSFERSEIKFGPVLGVGGFGIVFEVKDIHLNLPTEVEINESNNNTHGSQNSPPKLSDHTNEEASGPSVTDEQHAAGTDVAAVDEHRNHVNTTTDPQPPPMSARLQSDESQTTTTTFAIANESSVDPKPAAGFPISHISIAGMDVGHEEDSHYEIRNARKHMEDHVRRNGEARYAVKRLHRDLSDLERARGTIDLAIEAKFLSAVWHPNIIKMRGTASGPMLSTDFFIVMDRLYKTLNQKMKEDWEQVHNKCQGVFGIGADKLQMKQLMLDRLLVAYDLSAAFCYMHDKKLVYRDIKQENVGFDIRGDVKVFDLGLCKGLSPALKARDASGRELYGFNLTGRTGSVPYMSPEVVECQPYDCKADVFSFSILLWEMLSLKAAFKGYSRREFLERVVRRKERLHIYKQWPPLTRLVIKEAWDHDPEQRPDMKRVSAMLRGDLNEMTTDSKVRDRTQHLRERSAHSYRVSRALSSSFSQNVDKT